MKTGRTISRLWTAALYNNGIRLYRKGVRIAARRPGKARLMKSGHRTVFQYLKDHIKPGEKYVWVHTSSLGEFEQGRPLMERLRRERPDLKILLTFFSPSGYEVRRAWPGADAVCYLPFDIPSNVEKFLNMVQPVAAVFVKYEFWRNYLMALEERGIPTFLISGIFRRGQMFFRHGGAWYRRLLHCFTHLMVQDDNSRRLLSGIGVDNVSVCGDTRFDRVSDILQARRPVDILQRFTEGASTVFIAGSSWPADEKVYFPWLKAHPEVKVIIAPHEYDDERVNALLSAFPGEAVNWTQAKLHEEEALKGKRVLVMDCFGLLSAAYRYADIAYVGGGFGAGIHNINEAAVFGLPVLFGPNNAKFVEAREMKACGGGMEVSSAEEFSSLVTPLLDPETRKKAGEAASAYIQSKLGATDKCYAIIRESLPPAPVQDAPEAAADGHNGDC